MAYWFIKLGRKVEHENQALYEDFAETHSLIKIGYGIKKDITSIEDIEKIKEHITYKAGSKMSLNTRADIVKQFMHEIEIGDIVICPFHGGYMRVGKIVSGCKAIASFFKGEESKYKLNNFLAEHPNAKEHEYIKFKPARKVEWFDEKVSRGEFPASLQKMLDDSMKAVNKLELGSKESIVIATIQYAESKKSQTEAKKQEKKAEKAEENFSKQKKINDNWIFRATIAAAISAFLSPIFTKCFGDSCLLNFSWVTIPFPFMVEAFIILAGFAISKSKDSG